MIAKPSNWTELKEAGGDPFAKDVYVTSSSAGYFGNYSWYFHGTNGCLYYSNRYYAHSRCRPVLA